MPRNFDSRESQSLGFEGFVIGFVGAKRFWTSTAIDHENGRLTNEQLMKMSDADLKAIAFMPNGSVRSEMYRMPSGKAATDMDVRSNEVRVGACRAICILMYRREAGILGDKFHGYGEYKKNIVGQQPKIVEPKVEMRKGAEERKEFPAPAFA